MLNERLVPELVQDNFTPEQLVKLAIPLLNNGKVRESMLEGYKRLRQNLGSPGVTDRAAKEILDLV